MLTPSGHEGLGAGSGSKREGNRRGVKALGNRPVRVTAKTAPPPCPPPLPFQFLQSICPLGTRLVTDLHSPTLMKIMLVKLF